MATSERPSAQAIRALILDHALRLAAQGGLPAASIGALAAATGMTKSGVFAHFGSKPALDEAVVQTAAVRFDRAVLGPAAAAPAGVARLVALSEAWLALAAGRDVALDVLVAACPPLLAAPHDAVTAWQRTWRATLAEHAAYAAASGELAATSRPDVVAFEVDALLQAAWRDIESGDAAAGDRARYAIEHALRQWSATGAPPAPP
ncbi:MAG: TetR/AcrR family transcriptional regulator [Vicinamibacterales bacterium]